MRADRKKYLVYLAAACVLYGCTGSGGGGRSEKTVPEFVFTYAENQADDYPTSQAAYRFAELVKKKTDGRIEIQVKTGAALGDEKAILEQMQFGGIDFARVSLSPLSEIVPQMNILQMPYIYTGRTHMWNVLDGEIGDAFMEFFQDAELVPLSWYDAGARSFYTSEIPIYKLEDIEGLKIRVQQSRLMMDTIEILGGEAVPMKYEDVYSAIQKGEVDGAENNWPTYESEQHYKVAKYFTLDEHTRVPELQLASRATWNKLSESDQEVIRQCAEESAEYQRKLWTEREKTAEQKVRREGCQVIELSEAEKLRFRQAVMPIYEKYCAGYMDLVEQIREAGEK
ncbi:MAG: TRAP transporter substrate-binding protein [Lachnospiraceae bacterium]|nr:TRAP transporter substrate-binding protein [Lachnospiraceae bacterium]